jgi:hypothetical protein
LTAENPGTFKPATHDHKIPEMGTTVEEEILQNKHKWSGEKALRCNVNTLLQKRL